MTFKSDMAKFKAHLQHNVKSAHVAIGEAFLGNIINATPVDLESTDLFGRPRAPGRLKRSWFTGIGAVIPTGEQANPFTQMAGVLGKSMPDVTITMANGAPYAELIEYGVSGAPNVSPPPTWLKNYPTGIKFQFPSGWVRVEAQKITQSYVEGIVRGIVE